MVKLTAHKDYVESTGRITGSYGNGDAAHVTLLKANAVGKQMCVHLGLSGVFNNAKYWPLLVTDGLRLEFFVDSAAACTQNTAGNNTIALSNVNLQTEIVDVADSYMNSFLARLQSPENIKMHVPTYLSTSSNISASQESIKITEAVRSIKSIFSSLRETADLSLATVNSFDTRQYDLDEVQWRFGNKYYPNQPIKCGGEGTATLEGAGGSEPLCEVMKALNKHGGIDEGSLLEPNTAAASAGSRWSDSAANGGAKTDAVSEAFSFGVNLELDPDNRLSGLDGNRRNLDAKLKFDGTPDNALTMQNYVYYDQVVMLDPASAHVVF